MCFSRGGAGWSVMSFGLGVLVSLVLPDCALVVIEGVVIILSGILFIKG